MSGRDPIDSLARRAAAALEDAARPRVARAPDPDELRAVHGRRRARQRIATGAAAAAAVAVLLGVGTGLLPDRLEVWIEDVVGEPAPSPEPTPSEDAAGAFDQPSSWTVETPVGAWSWAWVPPSHGAQEVYARALGERPDRDRLARRRLGGAVRRPGGHRVRPTARGIRRRARAVGRCGRDPRVRSTSTLRGADGERRSRRPVGRRVPRSRHGRGGAPGTDHRPGRERAAGRRWRGLPLGPRDGLYLLVDHGDGFRAIDPPWQHLAIDLVGLAAGRDGLLAVGVGATDWATGDRSPVLYRWASPDGIDWRILGPPLAIPLDGPLDRRLHLVGDGDRLLGCGCRPTASPGTRCPSGVRSSIARGCGPRTVAC
jgi:hypothetical protein